jgi:hypothetical protein
MGPHEYEQVETEFPAAKYLWANWQEILFKSLLVLSVTSELPVGAVVHFFVPRIHRGLWNNAFSIVRFVGYQSHLTIVLLDFLWTTCNWYN